MDRRDIVDAAGGQRPAEVDLRGSGDRSDHPGPETSGSGNEREQDEENRCDGLRATTTTGCGGPLSTSG